MPQGCPQMVLSHYLACPHKHFLCCAALVFSADGCSREQLQQALDQAKVTWHQPGLNNHVASNTLKAFVTLRFHLDNCIIENIAQHPYCGGTKTPTKHPG